MTQIEHSKPLEIIRAWMSGKTGYFRDVNNLNEPIHTNNSFIEDYIRKDIHDKEIERLRANEKVLVGTLEGIKNSICLSCECALYAERALAQVKGNEND